MSGEGGAGGGAAAGASSQGGGERPDATSGSSTSAGAGSRDAPPAALGDAPHPISGLLTSEDSLQAGGFTFGPAEEEYPRCLKCKDVPEERAHCIVCMGTGGRCKAPKQPPQGKQTPGSKGGGRRFLSGDRKAAEEVARTGGTWNAVREVWAWDGWGTPAGGWVPKPHVRRPFSGNTGGRVQNPMQDKDLNELDELVKSLNKVCAGWALPDGGVPCCRGRRSGDACFVPLARKQLTGTAPQIRREAEFLPPLKSVPRSGTISTAMDSAFELGEAEGRRRLWLYAQRTQNIPPSVLFDAAEFNWFREDKEVQGLKLRADPDCWEDNGPEKMFLRGWLNVTGIVTNVPVPKACLPQGSTFEQLEGIVHSLVSKGGLRNEWSPIFARFATLTQSQALKYAKTLTQAAGKNQALIDNLPGINRRLAQSVFSPSRQQAVFSTQDDCPLCSSRKRSRGSSEEQKKEAELQLARVVTKCATVLVGQPPYSSVDSAAVLGTLPVRWGGGGKASPGTWGHGQFADEAEDARADQAWHSDTEGFEHDHAEAAYTANAARSVVSLMPIGSDRSLRVLPGSHAATQVSSLPGTEGEGGRLRALQILWGNVEGPQSFPGVSEKDGCFFKPCSPVTHRGHVTLMLGTQVHSGRSPDLTPVKTQAEVDRTGPYRLALHSYITCNAQQGQAAAADSTVLPTGDLFDWAGMVLEEVVEMSDSQAEAWYKSFAGD